MHFLCLHGSGTNSHILELQTAAIRYRLGTEHTYDFIEGEHDHSMEPSVAQFVSPNDTFHAYFDLDSPSSILNTLDELDGLISEAFPPYDGILAFSQGACLAATLLLRDANSSTAPSKQLKTAIFLSPGYPISYDGLLHGRVEKQKCTPGGPRITIPTALVYGDNDKTTPGHGAILKGLCTQNCNQTVVHHLGHTVPGSRQKMELERAVAAIKKTVATAERGPIFTAVL